MLRAILLGTLLPASSCSLVLDWERSASEVDAAAVAPDGSGSPADAGTAAESDASPVCNATPGVAEGPSVRAYYLVPSDREANPEYVAGIERVMRLTQQWFEERSPGGYSFHTREPVVETLGLPHPESYYREDGRCADSDGAGCFWFNVVDDASSLTGGEYQGTSSWLLFFDGMPACGQHNEASIDQVAVMGRNTLRALVGKPKQPLCPDGQNQEQDLCRAAASVVLYIGRAAKIPSCDGEEDCPENHLLGPGFVDYPDVDFRATDAEALEASPFFTTDLALADCDLTCEDPL